MTLPQVETHIAAAIGLGAFIISLYTVRQNRRVVAVKVTWKWSQPIKSAAAQAMDAVTGERPAIDDDKSLAIIVTNLRPRPVTIRFVVFEFNLGGLTYRQAIWRENPAAGPCVLTESAYFSTYHRTEKWAHTTRIYALDSNHREWPASRKSIRSIRDEYNPKGTVEVIGTAPTLVSK